MTPEERKVQLESFDYVWRTIRDKHWEPKPGGLDWEAVQKELRPKAERAESAAEIRDLMKEMLARLKQSHFKLVTVDLSNVDFAMRGDGDPGIELRAVDGAVLVSRVDDGVPVKLGWRVLKIRGRDIDPAVRALEKGFEKATEAELRITSMLAARLSGFAGSQVPVEFEDGTGRIFTQVLQLREPKGKAAGFGNLPAQAVFFEYNKLKPEVGYIRFNLFLDPARIVRQFGDAVLDCARCDGLVLDLRGNPGGIGVMATGIASWLVQENGRRLGTMHMRDSQLNFTVNARPQSFTGKVAILVDGSSASTAEIFAGGLRDLNRARIFGTRSAAAALPSMIERLPNGDYFQYAVANYISESGKVLEGVGVIPDEEVRLTRKALLAGHDPVIDSALHWISSSSNSKADRREKSQAGGAN